jgi:TRAP-type mannitol/chloroaromatic compound transport system substrate-binding protein
MRRRQFLKATAAGGVATAAASGLASPAISQGKSEWRMVTYWPKNSPPHKAVQRFAKYVEQGSEGRLRISVLGRGEVAPPPKMLSAVNEGKAEMGHGVPTLWAKKSPAVAFLVYFPFGLTFREKEAWFQLGGGQEIADKVYAELGCKFFPMGSTGSQMGGWFKRDINAPTDLKGLRIRIGGVGAAVMSAAGAKPVNIPLSGGKLQKALEQGDVDAAEARTPASDLRDGYHKVAKDYYYPNWHEPALTFDLFINKGKWDALPGGTKSLIETAAETVNRQIISANFVANSKALNTLVGKHGVNLKRFPDSVLKELGRLSAEVVPAAAAKTPLSKEIFDSMDRFRKASLPWAAVADEAYIAGRALALG